MIKIDVKITLKDRTYQIERFYTKGGQSFIYFAINLKEQTSRVVIKQNEINDLNELEILSEIHHPSLPKIIDSFNEEIEGESYHFVVLEIIDGRTLRTIIGHSDIPYIQTLSWAKQLLDILIYLQTTERKIVHKDICPNNIIIDDSNKVSLIDFGISKIADNLDYITGGTENYMPLEQFSNNSNTDFRSDIYSFSATIYHSLTNRKPEKSITRKDAIKNGIPDPLLPIKEIDSCKDLPEVLSDLISKGMSLDPSFRPKDANQMKSLLMEVEKNESFQNFLNYSQSFEPEIITITSPTKIKNNFVKFEIPIKHPKSISKNWGIKNIKKGSEASYSLYFLEDAVDRDRDERKEVKDRFVSVIGMSRIENDSELSRLLNILETLCKISNTNDENNLKEEIQDHRLGLAIPIESQKKPKTFMVNEFYQQNSRKIRLYFYRFLLFGLLLFFVAIFFIWYLFYPTSPRVSENPSPTPIASPTFSNTFIGKKGKIGKDANIRQGASQDSTDIGTIYTDSEIEILDMQQNDSRGKPTIWFKIRVLSYGCSKENPSKCGKDNVTDANEGWVSSQFIVGLQ